MKTKAYVSYESLCFALFGLGLSFGLTSEMSDCFDEFATSAVKKRLVQVSKNLAHRQGGHNKFLETITVFLDITAPRYWWQEFDTYRVGMTKQSESTMHRKMEQEFTAQDFEDGMYIDFLNELNALRRTYLRADREGDIEERERFFHELKQALPEGYLQRRIVCTNMKTLQTIYNQRKDHRLKEWKKFFDDVKESLAAEEEAALLLGYLTGEDCSC